MTIPIEAHSRISVLGGALLWHDQSAPIKLERKAAALLTYLAIAGEKSRHSIAALLWPETDEKIARNNLAQTLRRLKIAAGNRTLIEGGSKLRLSAETFMDVRDVDSANPINFGTDDSESCCEILAGLDYDDCPDFADWLHIQRARMTSLQHAALEKIAERAESEGEVRAAIALALRLRHADPCCETHHQRLIRLLWLAGDRNAALAACRQCRANLRNELGIEPSGEIQALAACRTNAAQMG